MSRATETVRLTADVVLLAERDGELVVLLIRRGWDPYGGCWALPGGHVDPGEEVADAARRELAEETGLTAYHLDLVGVYGAPGRDPRGRYVTWAYVGFVSGDVADPTAGDDARDARWVPVASVLTDPRGLAFDHAQILADARRVVCEDAEHEDIVWSAALVRDVTSNVLGSLLTSGVMREDADPTEVRVAVAAALAAAGIQEGAVR